MMQGKIIGNISNMYKIKTEEKEYNAYARGKLKNIEITPLVGDIVEFSVLNEEEIKNSYNNEIKNNIYNSTKIDAVIEKILPRKNELKRPKVANIDQIVFILSAKHPKPDLLMLDKQLAYAEFVNIKPIIIINKMDLANCEEIQKLYTKIGYKTIISSAKEAIGIEEIKKILKNKTSVFSGNSGVGKSSIINAIYGYNKTEEGEISKKNKKGKNTTTDTKLYEIEENTFIADTPGFSSFDITEIESTELDKCFKEFKDKIKNCEFVGCTHIKEKICGIKEAVENGKITQDRYDRYCIIYEELKKKKKNRWK